MIEFNLRKPLFALVLLLGATTAFAQKHTVRGVVTDDNGPLAGVTVVLRDPPPDVYDDGPGRLLCARCAR